MNINRIYCGVKQRIIKYLWNNQNNNIYFLMFHEVPKEGTSPINSNNFSITDVNFKKLLTELRDNGAKFISATEAVNSHNNNENILVSITFDDVYKSVIDNAVPILKEINIPYTLFISSSYIDTPDYISSEDIKALSNEPLCTIGFHTKEHKGMREFKTTEAIISGADCNEFEKAFNINCSCFAYPYGSVFMCPRRVIKAVADLNYDFAFGTIHSGANKHLIEKNRFYIPRLNVNDSNLKEIINKVVI